MSNVRGISSSVKDQVEENRYADHNQEMDEDEAERKRRQPEITARRLATRARNAKERPRKKEVPPKVVKPAAFYISPKIDPNWFPTEHHYWVACYFANLVRWRYVTWRANEDGFSQLLDSLLQKVMRGPGVTVKGIKQILLTRGVISCDRSTAPSKALGYQLTPEYRTTRRVVCTDEWLNRRIATVYAREERDLLPVHLWLKDKFELLQCDEDRAHRIIATLKPEKGRTLSPEEYRHQRRENFLHFVHCDYWFIKDKVGRFHTPITSLEEELRYCLSVNGEPLVNIGLANSQPLILGLFALQFCVSSRFAKARILDREFSDSSGDPYHSVLQGFSKFSAKFSTWLDTFKTSTKPSTKHTKSHTQTHPHTHPRINDVRHTVNPATSMSCEKRDPHIPPDLTDYLNVCLRGDFYESLMTPEQVAKGKKYRNQFKERFFVVLFGENRTKSRFPNAMRDRFRSQYPTVAGVLRQLKHRNFKHSSALLQNWEASFFIGIVCRRIREERPGIPLFTIHDSLLTTQEHADYVEAVVREEFARIGITPTLRKELYK